MADTNRKTDGPAVDDAAGWDYRNLPDWDNDFVDEAGIEAFANALAAPETSPSQDDLTSPDGSTRRNLYITALNDWRPVRQRVRRRRSKKAPRRGKDETREGFVYGLIKWPLLFFVFSWIIFLAISYLVTRLYIWMYEHLVTWRGKRENLRRTMNRATSYQDWINAAKELDHYLGNDEWKHSDDYAYYDSKSIKRITKQLRVCREKADAAAKPTNGSGSGSGANPSQAVDELCGVLEACVKNNFVGFENPRLYSESYYGTKDLVQSYVNEAESSLEFLNRSKEVSTDRKRTIFRHFQLNFGRTALCLSGGATFAYYHFGVAKALLDADLLPEVITGTSGGALVAALLATRTNEELKKLLVPALANRIKACQDPATTWFLRWWRTGARFDSIDWARKSSWFCRGDMTFREAYQRTGRILNVSCVPSDPHSPTILANYLTSPDCVIWSAVMASAAVPGILNPVVLMKKKKDGSLEPYSFGHKWKDGSLRTDIPLKALNLHFNVNFSIVSQVNPHVNLFFFSSRGTVGRPVTHRRGRGWRGGFLGSATEQYLKLDLTKWLKVLRHLELLPRPMNQDWSMLWLQKFNGTITLWPKSVPSDFVYILSDPPPKRLARMIHVGQLSAWPKLKFIANRMKIERQIEKGRRAFRSAKANGDHALPNVLSEDDLREMLKKAEANRGYLAPKPTGDSEQSSDESDGQEVHLADKGRGIPIVQTPEALASGAQSPTLSVRLSNWWNRSRNPPDTSPMGRPVSMYEMRPRESQKLYDSIATAQRQHRRGSTFREIDNQSQVFFDDTDFDVEGSNDSEVEEMDQSMPPTGYTEAYENPFDEEFEHEAAVTEQIRRESVYGQHGE